MKSKMEESLKEKYKEEAKNIETISSEDENSENGDQIDSQKNNIASLITTPYERVLSIINEAKAFILSVSSSQQNLIKGLEWAIKVISSHNLYTYELKDHEENEDFKQFQQFVNSYNDVIDINKSKGGKKSFLVSSLNLKRPSAYKYSISKIEEEKIEDNDNKNDKEKEEKEKEKNENPINIKDNINKITDNNINNKEKEDKNKNKNLNSNNKNTNNNTKNIKTENNNINSKNNSIKKKLLKNINNINSNNNNIHSPLRNIAKNNKKILFKLEKSEISKTQKSSKISSKNPNIFSKPEKKIKPLSPIRQIKKQINNIKINTNPNTNTNANNNINPNINVLTPKTEIKQIQKSPIKKEYEFVSSKSTKIIKTFNHIKGDKMLRKSTEAEAFSNFLKDEEIKNLENIGLNKSFTKYSSNLIENALNDINYPLNKIIEKTFNIFELKEIIGQDNVLPIMGKVILDSFGLYSDDIISTEKLDPFLVSISNQYYKTTLYHNSMHGADVTQSLCLYFLNSNAEEICQSLVLDLLGILISALGHDLGHPGLTNIFHINSSSELAITYNDMSCLENFHASKLFRTIRNPDTDIFEKLSVNDYKAIRKRMIGNILATDMANHGKIMTLIKSKIELNKAENKTKFELLSGNEKTKFEEQQSLFDFLIHAADLAHNTKLFNISLKWVELLTEEFWLQGDKEKKMNLPVSFLCDRESYNVPQSQVGFIKGFIIPTFDCLVDIFPSLKFSTVNARTNLKKWEKLACKGRLKGWTPEKTKQVNYKKKMILFSAISSINENSNVINKKVMKRKSGTVNSLSHALQCKEEGKDSNKDNNNEKEKKIKDGKNKIQRPNIIMKSKNHDKKVNIHRFNKNK